MKISIIINICVSLLFVGVSIADEKKMDMALLETDFNAAVVATGEEYFKMCEKIIKYGDKAKPFLVESSKNKDLHTRIVANALLSWIKSDSGAHIRRVEVADAVIQSYINEPKSRKAVHEYNVYEIAIMYLSGQLQRVGGHEGGLMGGRVPWNTADADRQALLLEVALKGVPGRLTQSETFDIRDYTYVYELSRVLAASLSGKFPCADTSALLVELLKTDESWRVRAGAAYGLERIGDHALVMPLLVEALSDQSSDVRFRVFMMLRRMTGEDLGVKKQWISPTELGPEQIEFCKKWWTDNKERILKEKSENDAKPNKD